jgi:hypothetical protein
MSIIINVTTLPVGIYRSQSMADAYPTLSGGPNENIFTEDFYRNGSQSHDSIAIIYPMEEKSGSGTL